MNFLHYAMTLVPIIIYFSLSWCLSNYHIFYLNRNILLLCCYWNVYIGILTVLVLLTHQRHCKRFLNAELTILVFLLCHTLFSRMSKWLPHINFNGLLACDQPMFDIYSMVVYGPRNCDCQIKAIVKESSAWYHFGAWPQVKTDPMLVCAYYPVLKFEL